VGVLDEWRFCPRCGEAIAQQGAEVACESCGFRAYANSVPGVEAVIVDGRGRVLLGRRAFEPAAGKWDLPGGFLDENEEPIAGLRREVEEETGLEIAPERFVGFYLEPYDRRTVLAMTWRATVVGGEPRAGDDLGELRWFAPDDLPREELAFTHYTRALRDALGHEHP
jgi:8-oxo-dGTP diphosphatase